MESKRLNIHEDDALPLTTIIVAYVFAGYEPKFTFFARNILLRIF